jgi:hypothetical protein
VKYTREAASGSESSHKEAQKEVSHKKAQNAQK